MRNYLQPIHPIQPKDDQVNNEHAKTQQPKKKWVEPELVSLGVDSGNSNSDNYKSSSDFVTSG